MKKPVLIVVGILLLAFISIYFVIPQKIKISHVIEIDATDRNVSKFLVNKKPWAKWWLGQHNTADSNLFVYQGAKYKLQESTNSYINLIIEHDDIKLTSQVIYAATGEGMCEVTWLGEMQSSLNPFERIAQYVKITHLSKNIEVILTHFKSFMQTEKNVYGMSIRLSKIKNPIVLASTTHTADYPSPIVVYKLVNELKKQISMQGALALDSPMMNVHVDEKNGYLVMIALPVNKLITPGPNTVINKLVKGANVLEAQVTGGKNTITNAFSQVKHYQKDHGLMSPAMPFELLITNRLAQKDTAKWVTKIYWPIY
ncbi:hypothetical protein EWM62_10545 [Mucilaginibacter terrigena]|uniref:Uncharacterized protein n=1 Tax=Mucilaginibacter terrigena TaxID=2492395 RepID=A0A4Q5LM14_9SPHI|nr:hypothetical protein [Mucilaginibacter terrigena]RYU89975.1 hypothetical protein EWM62_10545 [Mucilaginibacter terrigena]